MSVALFTVPIVAVTAFISNTKNANSYTMNVCSDIALTIIKHAAGEAMLRRLTPLSGLQEDILQRLGLGTTLSRQLDIRAMGT